MRDFTIGNIHIQDVAGTDVNLQPTVTKRVSFMVGTQGPFILTYTPQNYSAENVKADIEKECETLKAIAGE